MERGRGVGYVRRRKIYDDECEAGGSFGGGRMESE